MTELEQARKIINSTDEEMARLFQQRMDAVRMVANHKKQHGLPIEDPAREEQLIERNSSFIDEEEYRSYYVEFLRSTIETSKKFQRRLLDGMPAECKEENGKSDASLQPRKNNFYGDISHSLNVIIPVKTALGVYNVNVCRGGINKINEYVKNEKALIITDDGVPAIYAEIVRSQVKDGTILTLPQGEAAKSMENLELILRTLVENRFTRSDCIIAVGGGVVGDLSGFAASVYMRGIDFYNIPTTVLSQVDSSVGGKTAIDFMGIKNIVGAFYPPKCVIIDTETLKTLPKRQISNGLAEAIKMGLTNDRSLFELFEQGDPFENIDEIIIRSVKVKASVVEADERESGLRRVLNFGHTLAHAIESVNKMQSYYHGECVAMGMLPMCDVGIRQRVEAVLKKVYLPTEINGENVNEIITACAHDKKMSGDDITVVYVPEIGQFRFDKMSFSEYTEIIRQVFNK